MKFHIFLLICLEHTELFLIPGFESVMGIFIVYSFPRSCPVRRRGGGGRRRRREKHWCEKYPSVASCTCPDQGLNPQPRHVLWPGIQCTTYWCTGWCSNQVSHPASTLSPTLNMASRYHHHHPPHCSRSTPSYVQSNFSPSTPIFHTKFWWHLGLFFWVTDIL